jgi:aspartate aminotransferase
MEFSQRVENLSDSITLRINSKAKHLLSQGKDIINLSTGEPDLETPDIIKRRAKEAIDKGYTKYTPVSGIPSLKEAVVKRYKKKFKINLGEGAVLISTGAKQVIFNIVEALCGPGDEVIIPVPYWVSYPEIVKLSLAKPIFVDTSKTDYLLSPTHLEQAVSKNTKLILLNTPCNPTGVVYTKTILEKIAAIAKKRNIMCISDEIYDELVFNGEKSFTMLNTIESPLDHITVVNGVSKTFSMTGWRIGYAIASESVIDKATKIQSHTTSCPSSISQWAALAALEEADSFIEKIRKIYRERRDLVLDLLSEMKEISYPEPEGSFYIFFKVNNFFTDTIQSSIQMAEYLLEKYKVAVVPGSAFGDDTCLRLSYSVDKELLKEGITRIKNGLLNVH